MSKSAKASVCASLLVGAVDVQATVSVHLLPISSNYSVAAAVSNGGAYVTGYVQDSGVPAWPVLWTDGDNPVNIEGSSGYTRALGESISADGAVIVGRFGSNERPYRWTSATGMVPLQLPISISSARVNSVSGSGVNAVGVYTVNNTTSRASVWDQNGVRSDRLPAAGDLSSFALGVSFGGGTVVGGTTDPGGGNRGARWDPGHFNPVVLPGLPGMTETYALAVSADGSVVVGKSATTNYDPIPVRWDAAGDVAALPLLPGDVFGTVHGVSADGSVIAGECWSPTQPARSVLWLDGSIVALEDLLIGNGVSPGLARSLIITNISADGLFLSAYQPVHAPTSQAAPYLIEIPGPGAGGLLGLVVVGGLSRRRGR